MASSDLPGAPPLVPPAAAAGVGAGVMVAMPLCMVSWALLSAGPDRMTTGWALFGAAAPPPPPGKGFLGGAKIATNGWLGLLGEGTSWNRGADPVVDDPPPVPVPVFNVFGNMFTVVSLDFKAVWI